LCPDLGDDAIDRPHDAERRYFVASSTVSALLGTAVGDALGVPFEGTARKYMRRRKPTGTWSEFQGFAGRGLVSDDTQQAVLVATALALHPHDVDSAVAAYKHLLIRWFFAFPFDAGRATLRACVRVLLRRKRTGIRSAGNGAAMRSAVIGAAYADDEVARHLVTVRLSEVTHTHPDAVAGALVSAGLTACALRSSASDNTHDIALYALDWMDEYASDCDLEWGTHWLHNEVVSTSGTLRNRCYRAVELARRPDTSLEDVLEIIGNTGWTNHTIPLALYWFVRLDEPASMLTAAVRSGGDTDTVAAIVGAWSLAMFGLDAAPPALLAHLQAGVYGRQHLKSLATALDSSLNDDDVTAVPRIRFARSAGRNIITLPLLIIYAFRAALVRR
jgi:ADP-ribosylglycohydrolase